MISPIISLCGFFPDDQGQLTLSPRPDLVKFRTRRRLSGCPPYLKNEENPIKNRGARVIKTLYMYINFSDVQGQITLVFVVVSVRNLNSSKLSCMFSLPARMRLIKSKMEELECSQDFSHYMSMGIFPDAQGQLTLQSLVRSSRISNSSEMLSMSSLPVSMKKIRSKIEALEYSQHYKSVFQTYKGR